MKNNKLIITALLISFAVNLFAIVVVVKYRRLLNEFQEKQQVSLLELNDFKSGINESIIKAYTIDDRKIAPDIKVSCFTDSSKSLAHYLNKNGNTMIMMIPKEFCESCYNATLQKVKSVSKAMFYKHILVITDVDDLREVYTLFNNLHLDNTIIGLEQKDALPEIKGITSPYFYIIDSNRLASHYFVPYKNDLELTARLYKINERFIS